MKLYHIINDFSMFFKIFVIVIFVCLQLSTTSSPAFCDMLAAPRASQYTSEFFWSMITILVFIFIIAFRAVKALLKKNGIASIESGDEKTDLPLNEKLLNQD